VKYFYIKDHADASAQVPGSTRAVIDEFGAVKESYDYATGTTCVVTLLVCR